MHIICSDIDAINVIPAELTPRWLPELNISLETDSTEHSMQDCDISPAQSNISFGDVIVATPNGIHLVGSGEDSTRFPFSDSIISPSGSITVVHLLGALRSYDGESDYSSSSSSPSS